MVQSKTSAPAAPSNVPDNASPGELKALLDRKRLEIEGLRARLEAHKIADRAVVADLHDTTLLKFQGRSYLPQWMRDDSGALR